MTGTGRLARPDGPDPAVGDIWLMPYNLPVVGRGALPVRIVRRTAAFCFYRLRENGDVSKIRLDRMAMDGWVFHERSADAPDATNAI